MPGALPAVTVPPSGWKAGFSLASASSDVSRPRVLSASTTVGALLAGHLDRDDLVGEAPVLDGGQRALM